MNPHDPRLASHLKLFQALSMHNLDLAREALEQGADPNAEHGDGHLALTYCARGWESPTLVSMLQLLVESGARMEAVNRHGRTGLMEAARTGRPVNAQVLLDMGADPWAYCQNPAKNLQWTALVFALDADNFDIATMLVKHGGWNARYRTGDGQSLDELFDLHLGMAQDPTLHRQLMAQARAEYDAGVLQQKTPEAVRGFGMRRI